MRFPEAILQQTCLLQKATSRLGTFFTEHERVVLTHQLNQVGYLTYFGRRLDDGTSKLLTFWHEGD